MIYLVWYQSMHNLQTHPLRSCPFGLLTQGMVFSSGTSEFQSTRNLSTLRWGQSLPFDLSSSYPFNPDCDCMMTVR